MIEDKTAQAARLLLDSRNHRRPIEALPEYCRPATTAQAYAIQDAVADLLGPVGGWKVGAKGPDAQPNCAPLPATHVIEAPAQFPSREFPLRGIEAEIAFRLKHDLPRQNQPYRLADVLAAIGSVHPTIEVVESRYTDRTQVDSLSGLADSLSHGALVYGAGRRDNLAIDQLAQTATLYFNSAKIAEAKGANPAGDVLRLLVWLANHVASRHAGGLRAGQIITTGSCTGMLFADSKARVNALFPGLGSVELSFS